MLRISIALCMKLPNFSYPAVPQILSPKYPFALAVYALLSYFYLDLLAFELRCLCLSKFFDDNQFFAYPDSNLSRGLIVNADGVEVNLGPSTQPFEGLN